MNIDPDKIEFSTVPIKHIHNTSYYLDRDINLRTKFFKLKYGFEFNEFIDTYRHVQVSLICKTKYITNGTKLEGELKINALNLMFAPGLKMSKETFGP